MEEVEIKCSYSELKDIVSLTPNPRNTNNHPENQIKLLSKIIKARGFRHPIIVSKRSGFIVAGHGRVEAAKLLGLQEVPVDLQDFENEADEYAFLEADNHIARYAEFDKGKFLENIKELNYNPYDFDFKEFGLLDFELPPIESIEAGQDEDDVPEPPPKPITKLGDVWLLGNHRVMCGDSTMIDDVEKLMNGEKVDMVFTDPPYGMSAVSSSGVLKKKYSSDIMGDSDTNSARDSFNLSISKFPNAHQVWWGANYYCEFLPGSEGWIVWDKNNGQSDQTDCELAWTNFRSVVRQFTHSSEKTNRVHPTQKPVSLIEWTWERFKCDPSIILDLFLGSGSTLIACEKTNRKCYGMELDERYCDVIIKRWEKFTGKDAILEGTGETYKELENKKLC